MRLVIMTAVILGLTGCATQADRQAQWRAYADRQCAKLTGEGRERCIVDVVARCNSDHEIMGLTQKGCTPS
jgi:hypothetical protein